MACFRLISTGVTIFSTWTVFRAYRDYFFEIDTRTSVSWLTIPNVDMLKTSARGQNGEHSAEGAEAAGGARHGVVVVVVVVVARNHARRRSRAGSKSRVAAKHCNARAVLGSTKRNHVLADVAADNLTVLGTAVGQDVLDEIVSELVTGNCTKVSYRTSRGHGNAYCQ
jgi:hypothetical protein